MDGRGCGRRAWKTITRTVALVLGGFRLGSELSDSVAGSRSGPRERSGAGARAGGGEWAPGRAGRVRAPWWGAGGRAGVQADRRARKVDVQGHGVTE